MNEDRADHMFKIKGADGIVTLTVATFVGWSSYVLNPPSAIWLSTQLRDAARDAVRAKEAS